MYIAPNSKIYLLRNVPLDITQEHTIYWATAAAQATYFASKAKYTYDAQSYQRANRGTLRISALADNLYDCNYLMFQNTSFGTKWFYAFIKSVNYINNAVTEVEYVLDELQTWWFDYSFTDSFIVREHVTNDQIGDNLQPENLELGEYVIKNRYIVDYSSDMSIIVAATFDTSYQKTPTTQYSGLFSGLHFNAFPDTAQGRQDAAQFILGAGDQVSGIVAIFYAPTAFISNGPSPRYSYSHAMEFDTFGFYTPHNNKIYTWPYSFLQGTNLQGETHDYRFERWFGNSFSFYIYGDFTPNATVLLVPTDYKLDAAGNFENFDERITLTGFPQISFATDSYRAWLASVASQPFGWLLDKVSDQATPWVGVAASVVGGIATGLSSEIPGMGAVGSMANQIGNLMGQKENHLHDPNTGHGNGTTSTMAAIGKMYFQLQHKQITEEFARIIDRYWDLYGYASNRIGIPNLTARPHWSFIQTRGCQITGSIPADAARTITALWDKGITVWRNASEVGNYSLDNRIPQNSP